MKFKAKVRDKDGNITDIIVEGDDNLDAIRKCRNSGLFVTHLSEVKNLFYIQFSILLTLLIGSFVYANYGHIALILMIGMIAGTCTFLFFGGAYYLIKFNPDKLKESINAGIIFFVMGCISASLSTCNGRKNIEVECRQSGPFATDC
jgi:hypothetical protein